MWATPKTNSPSRVAGPTLTGAAAAAAATSVADAPFFFDDYESWIIMMMMSGVVLGEWPVVGGGCDD
jgi:hypothetical protein